MSNCKILLRNKNAKICDQKCHFWIFLTKNVVFWYFWAKILKNLLSYLKSASWKISICKISRRKQKWRNLEPKMPDLGIFGLEFENNIAIFEISAPSNLSICKISRKNKNAEIWDQKCLIRYF